MIRKAISLFNGKKDNGNGCSNWIKHTKKRLAIPNFWGSIKDYFFWEGKTIKNLWKPAAAGILCSALLITGISFIRAYVVEDSLSRTKENYIEAYAVYYKGSNIGLVENKQQVEAVLESIRRDCQEQYSMEAILNDGVELEEVLIESRFLSNMADIKRIIAVSADIKVKAVVLEINGKDVAVLKNEEVANSILKRIQEPYQQAAIEKGNEVQDVVFAEELELKARYLDYSMIEDGESVYQKLMGETEEKKPYIIQEGDSLWAIARHHNMTVEDIISANPSLGETDILKIGAALNLMVPEKHLNVVTIEEIKYIDKIAFATETRKSDSMYTNQTKIVQEGKAGEREVVAQIKKYNGVEKEREILAQNVVKEPVNKVIMQGTKKPPTTVVASRGSGAFSWPTRGSISSRFGTRWGRLHAGIDIANSKGTPIYAADSGTVSFSAYSGNYGNLVKINHGSGIETRYAHMSSKVVKQGQKVTKGQLIGYMGSSGRSTGSHLHFEVRVNGKAVNPLNYLK